MKKNKETALHVKYLILGGGITGLSTAYHLEKAHQTDYLVVEKNNFLGGLCAPNAARWRNPKWAGRSVSLDTGKIHAAATILWSAMITAPS